MNAFNRLAALNPVAVAQQARTRRVKLLIVILFLPWSAAWSALALVALVVEMVVALVDWLRKADA